MPERRPGAAGGDLRAVGRAADVDDAVAGRIRASGLAVLAIDPIGGLDGGAPLAVLADRHHFWRALFAGGFLPFASPVPGGSPYLDCALPAGDAADDRRAASARGP